MKKAILNFILILPLISCLFADFTNPSYFYYKLRREPSEDLLNYYFSSDAAGENNISNQTFGLSATADLDTPQFYIYGQTDWKSPYSIILSFTKLTMDNDTTNSKYSYIAHVFTDPTDSSVYSYVNFQSGNDEESVSFRGGNTSTYGVTSSFIYPISFSFADLSTGTYRGTIYLEVTPE